MQILLPIATAFLVSVILIPIIIRVFRSIDLLDIPDRRKIHRVSTPSLGGIAIFLGILFSLLISSSFEELSSEKYLIGGTALIFILGVRDDLSSLLAKHKLSVQLFATFMVVYLGNVEISGLHGLFGVDSFPFGINIAFTVFVIVVMTNAFNLIDGIDGLAGCIALIVMIFFSWYFLSVGEQMNGIFALTIAGAVLGFLIYNWYPSKVFMGDTGSMTLGFLVSVFFIKFLDIDSTVAAPINYNAPVAITIALLILPVYDTLRVFFIRFFQGKPPLAPDRNHIHHQMLKLGFNHGQSTMLLISYNILALMFSLYFQHLGDIVLIPIIFFSTAIIGGIMDWRIMKKEATRTANLVSSNIKFKKIA